MMAILEPRASWSLRGVFLPRTRGRHRRGAPVTARLVVLLTGYVALWAALATAASMAAA